MNIHILLAVCQTSSHGQDHKYH